MPAFTDTKTGKELFLCHNAKAGGSSVRDCLLENDFQKTPLAVQGGNQAQPWAHVDASMASIAWPAPSPTLAIVRHPYARVLSHYNYMVSHGFCGAVGYHDKNNPWSNINSWINHMYGDQGLLFKKPVKHNSLVQGPAANFGHLRSQVSLLYENTLIFKLEDGLDEVYSWVESYVGRTLHTKDLHRNRNKQFFQLEDMTNESKRLLANYYRQDFVELNYTP